MNYDSKGQDAGTPAFQPPPPGTQIVEIVQEGRVQELQPPTRTSSVVLPSQATTEITTSWSAAVRLVELQTTPGSMIEWVKIGQTKYPSRKEVEGLRVEANVEVIFKIVNPGAVPLTAQGIWFTEAPEEPQQPPAVPEVVNAGAPQGPIAARQQPADTKATPQVQYAPQQGVAQARHAAGQPVAQVRQHVQSPPPTLGYTQVGGGGQQFIHTGGFAPPVAPQEPTTVYARGVVARDGEVVLLITGERLKKIIFVLRGGIIMPQEHPAIISPIESALQRPRGQRVVPGANEIPVTVSLAQAQRIIDMIKGTDWQEIQGMILMLEQAQRDAV